MQALQHCLFLNVGVAQLIRRVLTSTLNNLFYSKFVLNSLRGVMR